MSGTTGPMRLDRGGLIDRSKPVSFTFDGRRMRGMAGDTLASALLAGGVRLVGRSFKYHRPRGIWCAGPEEPNALVELGEGARREPNTKAPTVELFDGLVANSQNRWPSLRYDFLSINQLGSPFFVGGFYYKTFMWPASFWEKVYEPLIRRAAGLGRVSGMPDPDAYETATLFCDVLVVGSGPAGLTAALAAGRSGARVVLCEDDFLLGGRLLGDHRTVGGRMGAEFVRTVEDELASLPNVRVFRRTQVFGAYDSNVFGAIERVTDHLAAAPAHLPRQRLWHIVAGRCVNAMGALERPIAFGGNDKPGVMLASAIRTYVNRFGVAPGRRVAIFTTSDDGWRTADDLLRAGVAVEVVVDARPETADAITRAVRAAKVRVVNGGRVVDVKGGASGMRGVEVLAGGRTERFTADCLGVAGGWNPQIAMTTHKGAKPRWSDEMSTFLPGEVPAGMSVAGAVNGTMTLARCLAEGAKAGAEAAGAQGFRPVDAPLPEADDEPAGVSALWHVAESRSKAFVDLQNDVTTKDVEIAYLEGFRSVEHLKRYTTLGMATDQGKTSNVIGHAMMAALTGKDMGPVGTTVSRPPHLPVALGNFAGHHRGRDFRPTRYPPSHDWATRNGGSFVEAGPWMRAQWYARPGETDWQESVNREVTATRSGVGICDVSTLGKIELKGRDVGAFLDRVYANTFSTLPVGKVRYGVMLREDGFVMDDGTTARLTDDRFVMSTTTANAGKIMQHLEFCGQALWPDLDVALTSVTEQWAQFSVAGPRSRELLENVLGPGIDLSNAAFPFMAVRELMIGTVRARLFRVSFSGELAYELAVPARYGESLMEALMEAGRPLGVTPYGTEALGVMRIEKGHAAGAELNGHTTIHDLGLGRMASTKKDYIGRVSSDRTHFKHPERPALVGLRPVDPKARIRAGSHFLAAGADATAANDLGYVTSVAYSPTLESWIGIGLIRGGSRRIGERMRAYDPIRSGDVPIEIVSPVFVDPEGARLHG